jgi:DNA topoisomerase-1
MSDKYLVIVESPTKQKTIGKILGKEYVVKSSFGHVRDLPKKELGVDEKNNFKPSYVTIAKSAKNITELKAAAKKATLLFLATDHDREGESIAWHLEQVIKPPAEKVRRITFDEITPTAVKNSIKNARKIDFNLVTAQQARRILDRLVGYKLSPLLWKKIAKGLSAGRVQSVAVRILAERAKEIENFKSSAYWSLKAILKKKTGGLEFEARPVKWQGKPVEITTHHKLFAEKYSVKTTVFKSEEDIRSLSQYLKTNELTVIKSEKKQVRQKPKPPFITSSLQQDAYTKLGFSPHRTMRTAQTLYEGILLGGGQVGLITYMRTDSYNLSKDIKEQAKKFIIASYGNNFLPDSSYAYKTKVKGAQEAHEAIHPTDVYKTPQSIKQFLTLDQFKLYNLIWLRFMACQMADALYESVSADIAAGDTANAQCILRSSGRTLKFEGYLKVYNIDEKKQDNTLPELNEQDKLDLADIAVKSHQSQPPPLYNEASLIKIMESHGIGRPSTYAPTIKTIIDRAYASRQKEGKFTATSLGTTVTDRLKDFFPDIMELSYTAEIEEKLDKIAEGALDWIKVVKDFYMPFMDFLSNAYKKMKAPEPTLTDEQCPLCQNKMLLRESRFGKYLSCANYPKCKGKIPLDEEGNKLIPEKTDKKCPACGKIMIIRYGRRGKFLACSDYPKCKTTCSPDAENMQECFTAVKTDRLCEKCKNPLVLRKSKKGYFLGCSKFPRCRNIVTVSEEEIKSIQSAGKK